MQQTNSEAARRDPSALRLLRIVAVSSPGGSGRFGNTGNVRIYSGAGIATTGDNSDDLLQSLFNPDPTASNFGISFEYADITGDGLKDFLVGADQYDSSSFQNADRNEVVDAEELLPNFWHFQQ